jgi:CBS domain-containing protein
MSSVKNCLDLKKSLIYSLPGNATVIEALQLMRSNRIRSVLVIDNGKLTGIVTQGDCAIKVLLPGRSAQDTHLSDIMTSNLVTISPAALLDQCMKIMVSRRIRHLPVVVDGQVVGLVSIGDIVKDLMLRQGQQIRHLETFITGHDPDEPEQG